ncbi:hypothetical protein [Georgenia wangjunii]|uniref:hypothetical protein n=1 Tax=Georgenia wangjunii TaxID=3117730 RepID=UPI002F26573A
MRLILQESDDDEFPGATCVLLLALNDSYEPVTLDHRLLVGPNAAGGAPVPVSVEPSQPADQDNLTVLGPWCVYGRLRSFPRAEAATTFHGYLVREDSALLPDGPADPAHLVARAEPLVVPAAGS